MPQAWVLELRQHLLLTLCAKPPHSSCWPRLQVVQLVVSECGPIEAWMTRCPQPMLMNRFMQEGGTLYTWGGMAASGGRGKGARYGHRGCLGVGDTTGRPLPTTCARPGF